MSYTYTFASLVKISSPFRSPESMGQIACAIQWVLISYLFYNIDTQECIYGASQVVLAVKKPPANVGVIRDAVSIPG